MGISDTRQRELYASLIPGHMLLVKTESLHRRNDAFTHGWAMIACGYPGCTRREGCAALDVRDARQAFAIVGWRLHADYGHICPRHY